MLKAVRISLLLLVLFFVVVSAWLTQARSTDWNGSLWVKIYPINADNSVAASRYIERLDADDFRGIETFIARESERYFNSVDRPVRVELGREIKEQPPQMSAAPNMLSIVMWSLKMRWWAGSVTDAQDEIDPDVQIFVRYHEPSSAIMLENSVGLQKGMVGIVNGYAGRHHRGINNVIIAHEFLHTLGATDKYSALDGHPIAPDGLAEPDRQPLYPQRYAEIMGGRIALADDDSIIPKNLKHAVIGQLTAREINLAD
jgi:hypothetical protein